MRVLYDVSVLGQSRRSPQARTGVFRVVENVASGLRASGECELAFAATQSGAAFVQSASYLRDHAEFRSVPILPDQRRSDLAVALDRLSEGVRGRSLPARTVRRLSRKARRLAESRCGRLSRGDLDGQDLFHSPFYALPRATRGVAGLRRCMTVYDLIPLLYPQHAAEGMPALLAAALAELDPDDGVLCISESTRTDFCAYSGFDPDRVFVTPLAAAPDLFHPCPEAAVSQVRGRYGIPDAPYLLSVNTLEPRKNLVHAVRSFARLCAQQGIRDLYLVLAGTAGWDQGALARALADLPSIRDRVLVTGYVADEDLAPLYSGALAFLYPSLYEGFGLPALEAMQCGVPIIASNTSSMPEVVGDAGVLVDPLDGDALCAAILELYDDPAMRGSMAARSLERAGRFSWDRCVRETLGAYRAILSR